ncbi:MAG: FHA domain-containing protein [Gammaproteobacteria bacterium]|nr:FHA domain-containing protein [Gammaproteobacteria bacterium]
MRPATKDAVNQTLELDLQHGILTIGRALDNDIVLDNPDVSEYHAKIVTYFHMALLIDLSSTTGSFLNGRHIIKHTIKEGDTITLGGEDILIRNINPMLGKTA